MVGLLQQFGIVKREEGKFLRRKKVILVILSYLCWLVAASDTTLSNLWSSIIGLFYFITTIKSSYFIKYFPDFMEKII